MKILRILCLIISFLSFEVLQAQDIQMADDFRGEGKIYVVVAVIVLLLVGVFIQIIRLDNKVKKLEKEIEE